MDIRQIKTFVEVSRLRSFSKAAETLFLTQPTVSNHIQALEKEFDTILINRLSRGLTLTEAGELLYANAVDMLNTYETAKFQLDSFKGKLEGHLEISASSVPRKYFLPILVNQFLAMHPGVTFSIKDMDSKEVIEGIHRGEIDFGFVGAKYETRNLVYIPVMDDELVLIAPPQLFQEYKYYDNIPIDEIINLPFIFREEGSGTRESIRLALVKKGFALEKLNTIAWVEDTEAIKKMVSLGSGCSFISIKDTESSGISINGDYRILRVDGLDLRRKFYMVFHKTRQLSPLGDKFKSLITSSL